jgi:hypothetical protein
MKPQTGRLSYEEALNECVELLRAGKPVDAVLDAHPEYAPELAPLVDLASALRAQRAVPARAPEVATARRERFMTAARQSGSAVAAVPKTPTLADSLTEWWSEFVRGFTGQGKPAYALAAVLLVILLLGFSATQAVTASASAMPGNPLYQVKLITEQVQLLLARDVEARLVVELWIAERRMQEARYIAERGLIVSSLPISGVLERFSGSEWLVAGQVLVITADTRIVGEPEIGARVSGTARAPGDGSLIALNLEVQPGRRATGARADETPTPTPTLTSASAPPAATATPTATAPPAPTTAPSPTDAPTSVPAPSVTPTRTSNPSPTTAWTKAPTRTFTPGPSRVPDRPALPANAEGTLVSRTGSVWRISDANNDYFITVNDSTILVNEPKVGDKVVANCYKQLDGTLLAWKITATGKADATPEPMDFSGSIDKLDGSIWVINGIAVHVGPNTEIEGEPEIYAFTEVDAERRAFGEIWAKRIKIFSMEEYEFTEVIELVSTDQLLVGGRIVLIDARTQWAGDPPMVGRLADCTVRVLPDGRLLAISIYIQPPTPTPSITPTRRPTRTPTPTPTSTPVPPPTQRPTASPPATPTLVPPTATLTPTSLPAAPPMPAATETAVPTATPTEKTGR